MKPVPTRDRVAATVRAELARQAKTGSALARHLGMPQSAVSRRLQGAIAFTVEDLVAVAEWLDIPVTTLLLPTKETTAHDH